MGRVAAWTAPQRPPSSLRASSPGRGLGADQLARRIFPKNLAEVEGGWLYRSGQIKPNLIEGTLRDLKIDLIVDLSHDLRGRDASQNAERAAAEKLGIEVQRFPMRGTGIGSVENYVGAIAAIERGRREGKRVLLHCRAGDKRTGGVLVRTRSS